MAHGKWKRMEKNGREWQGMASRKSQIATGITRRHQLASRSRSPVYRQIAIFCRPASQLAVCLRKLVGDKQLDKQQSFIVSSLVVGSTNQWIIQRTNGVASESSSQRSADNNNLIKINHQESRIRMAL